MNFLGIFNSGNNAQAYGHIKKLWEMANCDNNFDAREKELLYSVAKEIKVPKKKVDDVCTAPDSVDYVPPQSKEEKFQHMYNMVRMMLADGKVDQREVVTCRETAKSMKVSVSNGNVEELIYYMKENVAAGNSAEETMKRIGYMMI